MAECVEAKGRFADEIANGVWLICEESFWGVPAHLSAQRAGVGLPDVAEPIVELFAGETASLLAWTAYLTGPRLTAVSKLIPERIRLEIDRRILSPCLTRDDFGWMGFTGKPLNNWTPWICSNWITAALLTEFDETRRQAAVSKSAALARQFSRRLRRRWRLRRGSRLLGPRRRIPVRLPRTAGRGVYRGRGRRLPPAAAARDGPLHLPRAHLRTTGTPTSATRRRAYTPTAT